MQHCASAKWKYQEVIFHGIDGTRSIELVDSAQTIS